MTGRQLALPGMPRPHNRVANVASVKHRSPFRYPGGKTWLVPRVFTWLFALPPARRKLLVEPFAGGAIVGLSAVFEGLAERVLLAELDDQVAAVWETVINRGEGEWLAQAIDAFDLTPQAVDDLLAEPAGTTREHALQTIVKNRVNHGGILAPGAGRLKNGENGRGITSRWYPATLQRRIRDIDALRDQIDFVHGDALAVIAEHADRADAVFFADPPYTAAGKKPGRRLYTHAEIDHERLFALLATVSGDFLLTYDNIDAVQALAARHGFAARPVAMKNTHHAKQTELLIGRDLAWLDHG